MKYPITSLLKRYICILKWWFYWRWIRTKTREQLNRKLDCMAGMEKPYTEEDLRRMSGPWRHNQIQPIVEKMVKDAAHAYTKKP